MIHTEFILYSDHEALKHLCSQDKVTARHASWIAYLECFTFVVKHKSGLSNIVADALSRRRSLLNRMYVEIHGFETFSTLLETDPYFSEVLAKLMMEQISYLMMDSCLKEINYASQRAAYNKKSFRNYIMKGMWDEIEPCN